MAVFVVTAVVGLLLVTPGYEACRRAFGRDFLAFYAAGTLVREGRTSQLYDLQSIREVERDVARSAGMDLGEAVGPWWNPPIYAWAFAPLSAMPFGQALGVWTGVNLVAAAAAVWMLARTASDRSCADPALVLLLLLVSAPLLQSITHGQNSPISLLLVTIAAAAWRDGRTFTASACLGLLMYKPQLAAALAIVLVLHRGWRAGVGLGYVAAVVVVLTTEAMPGALTDYLRRLPQNLHALQVEHTYLWERHVTLKAFWRLLLQGRGAGETTTAVHVLTWLTAAPLLIGLPIAAVRNRSPGPLIAATIAAAPLVMPFYFDYDLLLLAVAATVTTRVSRRTLALWSALYLWLYVNPYVAGVLSVNVTVPLLWGLAATQIVMALRERPVQPDEEEVAPPAPLAKAA